MDIEKRRPICYDHNKKGGSNIFMQYNDRMFPDEQTDRSQADARIASLEKELAELKALLMHLTQERNMDAPEVSHVPVAQHTTATKQVTPAAAVEKKSDPGHPGSSRHAALIGTSFYNNVLMGTWLGKACYVCENGKRQNGEIALEIDQCCFYVPPNRSEPYIRLKIDHDVIKPIRLEKKDLIIASPEGTKTFAIHEEDRSKLQSWLEKRLPEAERVRTFPNVYLGFSDRCDDFPHPFLAKHAAASTEARKYLRHLFPVFGAPLSWYDSTVNFSVEEKQSHLYVEPHLSGEAWTWNETEDQIQIVLSILEIGFFDDSESEFRFEYTLSYIGNALKESECRHINNSKLLKQLPLSKWSPSESESFLAEDPFGMSGFYRIEWHATGR